MPVIPPIFPMPWASFFQAANIGLTVAKSAVKDPKTAVRALLAASAATTAQHAALQQYMNSEAMSVCERATVAGRGLQMELTGNSVAVMNVPAECMDVVTKLFNERAGQLPLAGFEADVEQVGDNTLNLSRVPQPVLVALEAAYDN